MITLGDLRARDILPSWQEAVAIAQEIVQAAGEGGSVPDLEHVSFTSEDGTVALLPGSSRNEHPVRGLAVILNVLLDGVPAPDQLKAVVARNLENPPEFQTLADFSQALTFFERPGRQSDIQALMQRASVATERTRADEELRRLQAKAVKASEKNVSEQKVDAPAKRPVPVAIVGGVAAAIVVVALAGAWYVRSGAGTEVHASPPHSLPGASPQAGDASSKTPSAATPNTGNPPGQPPSLLSRLGQAVRRAASSLTGSGSPAAVSPPAAAKDQPTRPERRRSTRRSPQAVPAAADPSLKPAQTIVIVTDVSGYPLEAAVPDPPVDTAFGIYTSSDRDVQAAVIIRPVLPTAPPEDVPADHLGTLEMLVDERGDVENVRLVSPFNRYQERMIVANAKTWKFQPATRAGRPVKYRTRVRLTI